MTVPSAGARTRFRAPFPLVEAKLGPIAPAEGSVPRERQLRLLASEGPPVVALIAPPGYGKSTLLAQWVAREVRPVVWLTVDRYDNDPAILLASLAAAIDRARPLDPRNAMVLGRGTHRVLEAAVPRLLSELHAWPSPGVIILDDVHWLVERGSLDLVVALLDHLPPGFRMALAARREPDLPLARLRANRRLQELDASRLALDDEETRALAAGAGFAIDAAEAHALAARTEGWAAGIYLALLARDHDPARTDPQAGGRYIADYLEAEVMATHPEDDLAFLTHTSILDVVTPELAEELTGLPRAADRLARLAGTNLLVQEISRPDAAYRYHNLLRDELRARLARLEPGGEPALHRRAARWHGERGNHVAAVEHALAARDRDLAATLVTAAAVATVYSGRASTVERWMATLGPEAMAAQPPLAVLAGWLHLLGGHADRADQAADIADGGTFDGRPADGSASFESQRAMLRAMMCRKGPLEALREATFAAAAEDRSSRWHCNATWLKASAHWLLDDGSDVEAVLAEAITGAPSAAAASGVHAKLAALRIRAGDWEEAARRADDAERLLREVHYDGLLSGIVVYAVNARVAAHRGDVAAAREYLVRAQLVRPLASHAAPWFSVDSLLELARAYLAVSDLGGAQLALREAEAIVRRRPMLGRLTLEVEAMRARLAGAASVLAGSSTLTRAELRVLPLLPTYLSFQEIADRLAISRNTVKTHAMAIYGKLWASSRGEAVERAVELGLLEPFPALAAGPVEVGCDAG